MATSATSTVEQHNKALFNQDASTYDARPDLARLAEALGTRIQREADITGKVCLDVGCGTGLVSQHIAHLTRKTYGFDVSQGMVDEYNRKARAEESLRDKMVGACLGVTDPSDLAAAQAAGAMPRNGTVNVAWSHLVLHHVDDCAALLAAVAPLLARPGKLFLSDVLLTDDSHLFHAAHAAHAVAHPGGFSQDQVRELLASVGLKLLSFDASSLSREKEVEVSPDGEKKMMSFPIFLVTAVKE